jgi:hypothetical protein
MIRQRNAFQRPVGVFDPTIHHLRLRLWPAPTGRWKAEGLFVEWDSEPNLETVKEAVRFLIVEMTMRL